MLVSKLSSRHRRILDGGFATELAWTHGHQEIDNDPLWSARLLATNQEALRTVHRRFLEAGADVIETSSYQASVSGFMQHLAVSRTEAHQLIVESGRIACQERDKFWEDKINREDRSRPLVAGSLGPYGAFLHDASEYSGHYVGEMTLEELVEWHNTQMTPLVESGVDLLAFETIPALKEAEAITQALRLHPDIPAWISFSCKDTVYTAHGESIVVAMETVARAEGVVAVGINCLPPQNVSAILKSLPQSLKDITNIVVYPNSGETWTDCKWTGKVEVKPLHTFVPEWLADGATWIGGCCRTTPSDIREIRKIVLRDA